MLWRRLVADLRRRSAGRRESGAFLLGDIRDDVRTITDYVMYDAIDPRALDSGYVHVDGRRLGQLWDICRARKTSVVADIHTHPGGYGQSAIDRKNPMIAVGGHIGIILPNYAASPISRNNMGIYIYQGAMEWKTVGKNARQDFFYIGV
ncbi:Mov34/MPN/PAD-1 family protein [Cupriavidus sp. EM10]|uniref:Mov34/MPN/PAD-1 family protein n=1 Tax=Cupriavidus sp. EM10 TaxID=2839983 RepID=UPI001C00810A|nr:Mov34/MPN/PAD-1 family protein [Cupriavidus sp. EM10]QWE98154.1 Mov34/MPN/PAD-1 family protein [Cupriavidus sp. EM10]